jgi:DNA mismatch repair ATPase MutS
MSMVEYKPNCERLFDIWNTVKTDDSFLDKYNYMEWDVLKSLNYSPSFLQTLSIVNLASPAISLFIPILFIIFPFLLLKIQGIPLTFNTYLDVLKQIAKNHFIGRTLLNLQSISVEKVIYIMVTFGLYVLQIYQNVTSCIRFYRNMKKINESLLEMKEYTKYSIKSMETFLEISESCHTYYEFNEGVRKQLVILRTIYTELQFMRPFSHSTRKINELGYMLKCFYQLYDNKEYEDAIRFSMGFDGYINNLIGVNENLESGIVSFADFEENLDKKTGGLEFKKQYYPPLLNESPVKNTCKFNKNMIISSPNKSGKTTILKTTTINIIFSQQLGCGFYSSGKLTPYTHIHSYLNIPDTSGRDSLFQAESRRCKEIIDIIQENKSQNYRHFCIFDELYSGTNPEEACKAGHAFLSYLGGFSNVTFILTTHYFKICKQFKYSEQIQNYKMDVIVSNNGDFEYTYKVKRGISKIKGGIRVLKDLEYPKEIIDLLEKSG